MASVWNSMIQKLSKKGQLFGFDWSLEKVTTGRKWLNMEKEVKKCPWSLSVYTRGLWRKNCFSRPYHNHTWQPPRCQDEPYGYTVKSDGNSALLYRYWAILVACFSLPQEQSSNSWQRWLSCLQLILLLKLVTKCYKTGFLGNSIRTCNESHRSRTNGHTGILVWSII